MERLNNNFMAVENTFLAKVLCNLKLVMLRMHLLGSRFRDGQLLSTSKVLSAILCRSLSTPTFAQAKLFHEKLRSRAFEAALPNERDAVANQISLGENGRQFLVASLQTTIEYFFMIVLHSACAEEYVFFGNRSTLCGVDGTTGHVCHEDILWVLAEGLDRAPSLPEIGANNSSSVGCSFGISSDGEGSSGPGACSS